MPAFAELKRGNAVVVCEPRGDHGLESYQLDDTINYFLMQDEGTGEIYYRVQMKDVSWEKDGYYETCSRSAFNKYFVIQEEK